MAKGSDFDELAQGAVEIGTEKSDAIPYLVTYVRHHRAEGICTIYLKHADGHRRVLKQYPVIPNTKRGSTLFIA